MCRNCSAEDSAVLESSSEESGEDGDEPPVIRPARREGSRCWGSGDVGVEEAYVYLLQFEDHGFYAGHTRSLRVRLMEHRGGQPSGTLGKNPRLVWFGVF